ncbi:MAG: endonuclease/exonuclease/phosphatase family protein [Elusimicrobiota bacterium]
MRLRASILLISCLCAGASLYAGELRVGTWNIHKGKRLDRVLEELKEPPLSDCDVLALQEVLTGEEGRQAKEIAEALGARSVNAGRDVIVSRLPILDSGEITLRRGRSAAWADLRDSAGRALRVYDVHLTYKVGWHPFIPEVRAGEMRTLLEHAKTFDGPVIILGDFNTVGWFVCCHRDAPLLGLLRDAGFREAGIEGGTQRLVGTVDWIFARGLVIKDARRGDYAGSDHRWITATLETPAASH